jgi:hypothetical protein
MVDKKLYVINNLGEKELLSEAKIIHSARRSGADLQLAKSIAKRIIEKAHTDMKTGEIYTRIKDILSNESPQSGMKYSLKEAVRKLGPAGY